MSVRVASSAENSISSACSIARRTARSTRSEALVRRDAQLALEVDVGCPDEHVDALALRRRERLRRSVDVAVVRAGERGHRDAGDVLRDLPHRGGLAVGCRWEPGLDDVHAEVRKGACDLELRLRP